MKINMKRHERKNSTVRKCTVTMKTHLHMLSALLNTSVPCVYSSYLFSSISLSSAASTSAPSMHAVTLKHYHYKKYVTHQCPGESNEWNSYGLPHQQVRSVYA